MVLSNCFPIEVAKPRVGRRTDGSFKSLPTQYLPGIFWNLFRAVQDAAIEIDLLNLEKTKRRAEVRIIVKQWLFKNQARKIERQKKDESVKPPNPSPPCKCSCASCAHCAAKGATASEAENGARPAERRIDKAGVALQVSDIFKDFLFERGQEWMNLNLSLGQYNVLLDN